jgi:hypothetical protein
MSAAFSPHVVGAILQLLGSCAVAVPALFIPGSLGPPIYIIVTIPIFAIAHAVLMYVIVSRPLDGRIAALRERAARVSNPPTAPAAASGRPRYDSLGASAQRADVAPAGKPVAAPQRFSPVPQESQPGQKQQPAASEPAPRGRHVADDETEMRTAWSEDVSKGGVVLAVTTAVTAAQREASNQATVMQLFLDTTDHTIVYEVDSDGGALNLRGAWLTGDHRRIELSPDEIVSFYGHDPLVRQAETTLQFHFFPGRVFTLRPNTWPSLMPNRRYVLLTTIDGNPQSLATRCSVTTSEGNYVESVVLSGIDTATGRPVTESMALADEE